MSNIFMKDTISVLRTLLEIQEKQQELIRDVMPTDNEWFHDPKLEEIDELIQDVWSLWEGRCK